MDTLFLAMHGGGDCVSSIRYAVTAKRNNPHISIEVLVCARDEIFKPLDYLYGDLIHLYQSPLKEKWGDNLYILNNQEELKTFPHPNKYLVLNDLLYFNHPLAVDWKRFNLHPSIARQNRVLNHKWKPKKIISAFLNTTTTGYDYKYAKELVNLLANNFPDYYIYFPVISSWNNQETNIKIENTDIFRDNVILDINPDFCESLGYLLESSYGIVTDCGPLHFMFDIGLPRLILDPRLNYNNIMWTARWREISYNDSIPIQTPPKEILDLVKTNINIPQTTLLPRHMVLELSKKQSLLHWEEILGFKF